MHSHATLVLLLLLCVVVRMYVYSTNHIHCTLYYTSNNHFFFHQYRHVRVCGDAAARGGAFGASEVRAGGDEWVYGVCPFVVCTHGGSDVEGSVEEGKDGGEEWADGGGGACHVEVMLHH